MSVMIGFALVLIYMALFYRGFGMMANVALTLNLMLLVACMSILSATLTLPGIAGIVLTVGMAVDANVDRKSTRLNSSHVRISYAVFCLKKKTNRSTISCTSFHPPS